MQHFNDQKYTLIRQSSIATERVGTLPRNACSPFIPGAFARAIVLGRFVAIEHPNATFVPGRYVGAATQLFGVQFAVATYHEKILPLHGGSHLYLGLHLKALEFRAE
jgi:hypothetical protein